VHTYVNNILIGKRYLDHRGTYHVTQLATGDHFKCKISEPIFGKSHHEVGRSSFLAELPVLASGSLQAHADVFL
jgi:hypothetical protein